MCDVTQKNAYYTNSYYIQPNDVQILVTPFYDVFLFNKKLTCQFSKNEPKIELQDGLCLS